MVIFDQLRISDDGRKLYINVHVNGADYFEHVYLDTITVMTHDKVTEATYAGSPTDEYIYKKTFGTNVKSADIVIDKGVLDAAYSHLSTDGSTATLAYDKSSFSSDLLFVYVKVKGEPDECTPCSLDKEITVGVTFDDKLLHQKVLDYTRELADGCTVPIGFTDFILLWNAFKSSVETEHFVPAIKYWKLLFDMKGSNTIATYRTTKPCGCHG